MSCARRPLLHPAPKGVQDPRAPQALPSDLSLLPCFWEPFAAASHAPAWAAAAIAAASHAHAWAAAAIYSVATAFEVAAPYLA